MSYDFHDETTQYELEDDYLFPEDEEVIDYGDEDILADEFSDVLANTKDDDTEIWWEL